MSKIYVKPAKGRMVLLPKSGPGPNPMVPDAGMWVDEDDTFIIRRLAQEDLVKADPPKDAPKSDQTPAAIAAPAASVAASGSDAA